jgi:hypothetical protein
MSPSYSDTIRQRSSEIPIRARTRDFTDLIVGDRRSVGVQTYRQCCEDVTSEGKRNPHPSAN